MCKKTWRRAGVVVGAGWCAAGQATAFLVECRAIRNVSVTASLLLLHSAMHINCNIVLAGMFVCVWESYSLLIVGVD
ncbi:unnamed protein product [Pieris brassicae]|uniref:Uncharacterized protein n=1 Tax=Pieris brassicae TaxID=7116 RepID=A0A9P0WUW1_PIEBR|nr:unnamed protein product [Pieris brassicae]